MAQQTDYRGFRVLEVDTKIYCDDPVVELVKPNSDYNPNNNYSEPLIVKRVRAIKILGDFSKLEDALLIHLLSGIGYGVNSDSVGEITLKKMVEQYEALRQNIVPYVYGLTRTNIQPANSL
jgi:hypothetical protein